MQKQTKTDKPKRTLPDLPRETEDLTDEQAGRVEGGWGDGKVDAADYVVWRKTDGSAPDSGGRDFLIWQRNYGTTPASAAGDVEWKYVPIRR